MQSSFRQFGEEVSALQSLILKVLSAVVFVLYFSGSADAGRRVALVIGNSAYENVPNLANPKNDAEGIAAALNRLNFKVILGVDLSHSGFVEKIKEYTRAIRGADIALVYYAGHGLQVRGQNYLAPVDTELFDEADLEFETIRLEAIMSQMERERRINLVFLDACRDNPLTLNLAQTMGTRSLGPNRGLAPVETGVGTLVAYSTQPGNVAYDGSGQNSPFTGALLQHLEAPGDDIAVILRKVRQQVLTETGGKQVPWSNSSLTGPVILKNAPKPDPQIEQRKFDLAYWESIKGSEDLAFFENYLDRFPKGEFVDLANLKLQALRQQKLEQQSLLNQALENSRKQASALEKLEAEKTRLLEERKQETAELRAALAAAGLEAQKREDRIERLNREKAFLEETAKAELGLKERALDEARQEAAEQLKQLERLEREKLQVERQSLELSAAQQKTLDEANLASKEKAAQIERLRQEKERLEAETAQQAVANRKSLERAQRAAQSNAELIAKLETKAKASQRAHLDNSQTVKSIAADEIGVSLNPNDELYKQVEGLEAVIKAREREAKKLIEKLEAAKKARREVDMDVAMLSGSQLAVIRERHKKTENNPFSAYDLTIPEGDPDYGLSKRDLARRLQEELNRSGCSAGTVDGIWGRKSTSALRRLINVKELKISSYRPDPQMLALARQHPDGSCRLECAKGFVDRDGACVRPIRKKNACERSYAYYAGSRKCR